MRNECLLHCVISFTSWSLWNSNEGITHKNRIAKFCENVLKSTGLLKHIHIHPLPLLRLWFPYRPLLNRLTFCIYVNNDRFVPDERSLRFWQHLGNETRRSPDNVSHWTLFVIVRLTNYLWRTLDIAFL